MFKIKLSILLLISFFIFSCSKNQNDTFDQKYSLAYIGGDFDGLLLKNYLQSRLKNLNILDPNSNFEIRANIIHNSSVYITNIDNTSDREKISTTLSFQIVDTFFDCLLLSEEINVSQFYIYAPSDKFLSNLAAVNKIKKINTESAVQTLTNIIRNSPNKCDEN